MAGTSPAMTNRERLFLGVALPQLVVHRMETLS